MARGLAKNLLINITNSYIRWAAGGFQEGREPSIINDPGAFFNDFVDNEVGRLIDSQGLGFLCDDLDINISAILELNYITFKEPPAPRCKASDIIQNLGEFDVEIDKKITTNEEEVELGSGGTKPTVKLDSNITGPTGTLSRGNAEFDIKSVIDENNARTFTLEIDSYIEEETIVGSLSKVLGRVERSKAEAEKGAELVRGEGENPNIISSHRIDQECLDQGNLFTNCLTVQQGPEQIASTLDQTKTSHLDQLENADELSEVLEAVVNATIIGLLKRSLDKGDAPKGYSGPAIQITRRTQRDSGSCPAGLEALCEFDNSLYYLLLSRKLSNEDSLFFFTYLKKHNPLALLRFNSTDLTILPFESSCKGVPVIRTIQQGKESGASTTSCISDPITIEANDTAVLEALSAFSRDRLSAVQWTTSDTYEYSPRLAEWIRGKVQNKNSNGQIVGEKFTEGRVIAEAITQAESRRGDKLGKIDELIKIYEDTLLATMYIIGREKTFTETTTNNVANFRRAIYSNGTIKKTYAKNNDSISDYEIVRDYVYDRVASKNKDWKVFTTETKSPLCDRYNTNAPGDAALDEPGKPVVGNFVYDGKTYYETVCTIKDLESLINSATEGVRTPVSFNGIDVFVPEGIKYVNAKRIPYGTSDLVELVYIFGKYGITSIPNQTLVEATTNATGHFGKRTYFTQNDKNLKDLERLIGFLGTSSAGGDFAPSSLSPEEAADSYAQHFKETRVTTEIVDALNKLKQKSIFAEN